MFRTEAGSIEVVVEMGRQILGMVLTMYLPTSLMNIIGKLFFTYIFCFVSTISLTGHSTNYMKRFFFEAQVPRMLQFCFEYM